jgi:hypothetical protein
MKNMKDMKDMKEMKVDILSRILSSESLKIESEDWLYNIIWELVEIDRSYFSLLEFVQFEFVSTDIAARFIQSSHDLIDFLNSSIWMSLGRRFIHPISPSNSNCRLIDKKSNLNERRFSPNGKSLLDGIIAHLTSICGGNVHDNGIISVSASSENGAGVLARNAVDLDNRSSCFQSSNVANSWLCYDFKQMEVTPTHYSILSYQGAFGCFHPKSWCLEVSKDGNSWTEIHRIQDNNDLNDSNKIGTYEVTKSVKCRFIRLRQTGRNHVNYDYFLLSGFEIFGLLHEP